MVTEWPQNAPRMVIQWSRNGPKVVPKWSRNGPKVVPEWSQNDPKWSQNGPNMVTEWFQNGPKMIPEWSQNDPKSGSKVAPKWSQSGPNGGPLHCTIPETGFLVLLRRGPYQDFTARAASQHKKKRSGTNWHTEQGHRDRSPSFRAGPKTSQGCFEREAQNGHRSTPPDDRVPNK